MTTNILFSIMFSDLNKTEELNKLRSIYQTYAQDLSKDSSHEIRTKVDNIKVYFT